VESFNFAATEYNGAFNYQLGPVFNFGARFEISLFFAISAKDGEHPDFNIPVIRGYQIHSTEKAENIYILLSGSK
jgi:hypothetical protein